ncbi:MAG: sigma-70 family RNA polymerase sigma factor, partial [Phycisphaerae bacterium]|nr:sigma-70 family RNA polymerase sigma factor [Phycisphaerae bacterium]
LRAHLTADKSSVPFREMAAELNMSEGAVRVAAHRLRRRYRELLWDEIAQTVTTEDQIDQEIRDLFAALAR